MSELSKATAIFLAVVILMLGAINAFAQDKPSGSWWDRDKVRACCSQSDAVWADTWSIDGDTIRATVTGGGPREHSWAPVVREYIVPKAQWLDEPGNPTGRAMLFLNPHNLDHVFCMALGPLI